MIVSYRHEIPMGHRLKDHPGKCKNLHGHNYLVTVSVQGSVQSNGMVIDFSELKRIVRGVLGMFDHTFVLQRGDGILDGVQDQTNVIYLDDPPTAENLALTWQSEVLAGLADIGRNDLFVTVKVRETRDCEVRV